MKRTAVALCALVLATPAPAGAAGSLEAVEVFTLSWVGDIAFSSAQGLPSGGVGGALGPIRRGLRADVVTGNLEGTLASTGSSKCGGGGANCYAFRAPPSYAGGLRRIGFDVMNLANNHANDYGPGALAQTVGALRGAGIAPVGVGSAITRVRVNGARLAFVGFSSYPWSASLLDIGAAQRLVRAAGADSDLVVVMFHGGAEGADRTHVPFGTETAFGENRGNLRAFAHGVIDAGAGLVLGSGPHVIRGIERYRGRLIAYSLGNFAGPNTLGSSGVTGLSAILRLRLTDDGDVLGGRWIPIVLPGGLPRFDPSYRSVALVRSLTFSDFKRRFPMTSTGKILPAG